MSQIAQAPSPQILRLPAVMYRTGMGRSWIYREMKANRFPQAVKIGRASGWDAAAIATWIEARLRGRNLSVQPSGSNQVQL